MHGSARRFSLRERTSSLHEAVDAAVGSFETAQDYVRYVVGTYRFRHGLEERLKAIAFPSAFAGWQLLPIASLAKADLADLKQSPAPDKPFVGDLSSSSCLIGALYVLEGSALGARVLYKRAQSLGYSGAFGARHLAAQAQSNQNWRAFLELLDAVEPFDLDAAAQGSALVFDHAARAFENGNRHAA